MTINRKLIATEEYRGRTIEVRFMGPDVISMIDGVELPNFFLSSDGARRTARRCIDDWLKEQEK